MSTPLRLAFRQLAKSPGFTTIALLTLALGLGVNTSMFSMLNTLLFHLPPYPEPETLLRVFRTGPHFQFAPHAPANALDFQAQARSFSQLAIYAGNEFSLIEPGQPPERLRGMDVSGEFFAALGAQPALGRFITAEDDHPGHSQVVVLSDTTWRQRFGADPAILEHEIRLNGELVTVIGVMPRGFDDPLLWGTVALWRPLAFTEETRKIRGSNWLNLLARLKPGVSSDQALAELNAISANLGRAYPETNAQTGISFVSLVRSGQGSTTTRLLSWFAMGLAGCVLLIACANLANLLFARNALRARDHAIRSALGASRWHLVSLALTECLVLALAGGVLGLLVASWCNHALGSHLRIAGQDSFALSMDWRVVAFSSAAALWAGMAFGILPAVFASRTDLTRNLKQGGRGSTSGAHHRLRHTLVVAEVALALVLLSGAAFFIRGLDRFLHRDLGWRPEGLLTAYLTLPWSHYRDDAAIVSFYDRLQTQLSALPGVERAALSRTLPFSEFGWGQRFLVEGQSAPPTGAEPMRDVNGVSPDYFDTLALALVAGRGFTPGDMTGAARTIINESMARKLWPGESAIGKRIRHPSRPDWQEIIGVVRDVSFAVNIEAPTSPYQTYRLLAREPGRGLAITLRSAVPPATLAEAMRRVVATIDPELPVHDIQPAVQAIDRGLSNYALTGWLLSGFALLGLLLSAVGLYGVISGFVTHRTNEIGLRMALGAQIRDVLRLVLGQGLRLALIGTALGLAGAWGVARLLVSIMPALPAPEAATAAGVTFVLIAVALLACWLPARRAARVDPMAALRAE